MTFWQIVGICGLAVVSFVLGAVTGGLLFAKAASQAFARRL